ncbi:MAG: pyrroloquinoline quinone biosynthesis protein PqqB [Magnetovibrionaceae bacterium]
MEIVVLGSGAGGGFPQWNCNSQASNRARHGDPKAKSRTQSSLAVCANGKDWVLLNASPDIRHQINTTPALYPAEGLRHSPISAVLLTNADVDHVAGLLTLRESHPFAIYGTGRVLDVLGANSIFNVVNPDLVPRRPFGLGQTVDIRGTDDSDLGLRVELFGVPGKVALWLEDESKGANFGSVEEDTIGLRIEEIQSGKSFYYIPGCAAVPNELKARVNGTDLLFFDGTTWTDDEMPRMGLGPKTGKRMGHICMSGAEGSIAAFAEVSIGKRVFVHINNSNPALLEDSEERKEAEKAGWIISEDGMEFRL